MARALERYHSYHQCLSKSNTRARQVLQTTASYHHMRKWEWLSSFLMLVSLYLKNPQLHQACQVNSMETRDLLLQLIQCSLVVKNPKSLSNKLFHQGIQLLPVEPSKYKILRYQWRVVGKISTVKGEDQACVGRKNQSPLFSVALNPHLQLVEVVVNAWPIQMNTKKRSFLRTSTV